GPSVTGRRKRGGSRRPSSLRPTRARGGRPGRNGRRMSIRSLPDRPGNGRTRRPGCTGDHTMSYIDGFVLPIRKDRIEDYRRIAHTAGGIWSEHGALDYHECIAEDLRTDGGLRSYVDLLQLGPDETVVFAWIE